MQKSPAGLSWSWRVRSGYTLAVYQGKGGKGGGGGGWEKDSNNCWSKNIDSKLSRPFNCTPKHKAYWFSSRVFSFRALLPIQIALSLSLTFVLVYTFVSLSFVRGLSLFLSRAKPFLRKKIVRAEFSPRSFIRRMLDPSEGKIYFFFLFITNGGDIFW